MIYNILNTIGSRFLMALISLILLLLSSNYLGAEGLGSIGLIVLGISIIQLLNNFVNGGGLIYYTPRFPILKLFGVAYLWIAITILVFIPIILFTPLFIKEYAWDILLLGIILSAVSTHNHLLLGKEKVKFFNLISLSQSIIQLISLLYLFFVLDKKSVDSFILSTYISYSISLVISFLFLVTHLKNKASNQEKVPFFGLFKKTLNYGFYLQLANIFQLLNYRLSYFLLQFYSGKAAVGIYTPGVQLSEGILLPTKSIATVQYARISNMKDDGQAIRLTLALMKVSFFLTLPILALLMLIPSDYYTAVLGSDFSQVKQVIAAMSIGIISLSMEGIVSGFFSGTGRQKTNSLSAFIGFLFTVVLGFYLIPKYGVMGAAYTATISYLSMFLFMIFQLNKYAKISFKAYLPNSSDIDLVRKELKKLINKSKRSKKR